jgi:penicillin-binding protein 2
MALAGLEEKIITPQTKILSTGGIRYGNWFYADWKVGGHGLANIFDALAWSINTFFYYVGGGYGNFVGLGPERIAEYLKKVGLDATTNIDLPGERKGRVPDPEWKEKTKGEPWFIGDTYHLSIGQGDLLVTPLQVAYYTSLIANYGTAYQPHLVQKIVDPQSSETNLVTPNIQVKNIFKPENILVVRQGMREAVQRGSAMNLSSLPFTAAGKTGTAQVSYKQPHAWFTGFAPFDQPEIVVTVLLENGGEGSALPVQMTKEIMQYYFSRPE